MFLTWPVLVSLLVAPTSPTGPPDAHSLALVDLATLAPTERPFVRWLRVPGGVAEDVKVCSFTLNHLSSVAPIHRPPLTQGILVRVDLRNFVRSDEELKRWLKTWEELVFDPSFSLLVTKDTIDLLAQEGQPLPFGVKEISKEGRILTSDDIWVDVIRFPRREQNQMALAKLTQETGSLAPVVDCRYFVMRSTSTIQDSGLYKQVFGGLYYEFTGVRTAKGLKKGTTDLDVLFQDLGILDDATADLTAQQKMDLAGADQRVVMIRSNVTGKPRLVFIFPILTNVRQRTAVFLTQDVRDESIDLLKYGFANLLEFKADAMEVIWVKANGSQGYALYNGKGELQREVPPDIANDHTIPAPYTQRLQTTSCIVCHHREGLDGWQPIPNEVRELLEHKPKALILTDVGNKKRSQSEALSLIRQKYDGNADGLIMDLRRQSIGSTLLMTGPWKDDKDQTGVLTKTAARYEKVRKDYWFTPVTASVALTELGYDPGTAKPVDYLNMLIPPDLSSAVDRAFVPEDVRIKQLLAGRGISRTNWSLVQGFAAGRAAQTFAQMRKEQK